MKLPIWGQLPSHWSVRCHLILGKQGDIFVFVYHISNNHSDFKNLKRQLKCHSKNSETLTILTRETSEPSLKINRPLSRLSLSFDIILFDMSFFRRFITPQVPISENETEYVFFVQHYEITNPISFSKICALFDFMNLEPSES